MDFSPIRDTMQANPGRLSGILLASQNRFTVCDRGLVPSQQVYARTADEEGNGLAASRAYARRWLVWHAHTPSLNLVEFAVSLAEALKTPEQFE